MGVPRAHSTRGQKGRRRSHLALVPKAFSVCPHCGKPRLPHMVCAYCGFYKDTEVVHVLTKDVKKKEKK